MSIIANWESSRERREIQRHPVAAHSGDAWAAREIGLLFALRQDIHRTACGIGSPQNVPSALDDEILEGSSMKSVTTACFVLLGCLAHGAMAQPAAKKLPAVDFSAMTCEQFWEKTTAADRGPFLFWLSGYFGHKKNSPVLDPVDFTEKTKALSQYCSKQPNDSVLSVAEKAFAN
jgi:hypothetical protein